MGSSENIDVIDIAVQFRCEIMLVENLESRCYRNINFKENDYQRWQLLLC